MKKMVSYQSFQSIRPKSFLKLHQENDFTPKSDLYIIKSLQKGQTNHKFLFEEAR